MSQARGLLVHIFPPCHPTRAAFIARVDENNVINEVRECFKCSQAWRIAIVVNDANDIMHLQFDRE